MAEKLTPEQWADIRIKREVDRMSFKALSVEYGVSVGLIHKRSKAQNWSDGSDGNEQANKIARERVQNIVNEPSSKRRYESILEAANAKAEIMRRQQMDWEAHRDAFGIELMQPAIPTPENGVAGPEDGKKAEAQRFHQLKCAKITAEMLTIRHAGERKAYNISDDEAPKQPGVTIVAEMSDAELARIARGVA